MSRELTSSIIDNLLKLSITTGVVAAGLLVPNLLIALDKPHSAFMRKMDKRSRERELRRVVRYMKHQNLLKGNYEHGLTITKKGRARLDKAEFDKLAIKRPEVWDRIWRLVLFDIPETNKNGRNSLSAKLK